MNTISIISFIVATTAVAIFTYMIVRNMKKSDSATEEYFTGGRALSWYMVGGSLLLKFQGDGFSRIYNKLSYGLQVK